MRVLFVNTFSDYGGAAIAARRQYEALKKAGVEAKFFSLFGKKLDFLYADSLLKKGYSWGIFSLSRLYDIRFLADSSRKYEFDSGKIGISPVNFKGIKEADIIHLHWVNFGFFSVEGLRKLLELGKPVVWTLHDMWALTGGCFYAIDCEKFKIDCDNCPLLKGESSFAKKRFLKKQQIYSNPNLHFVAISSWMQKNFELTGITDKKPFYLPNLIDTQKFKPLNKDEYKQKLGLNPNKIYIGFIAHNLASPFKGVKYFISALEYILSTKPELSNKLELIAIGKVRDYSAFPKQFKIHFTGYIDSEDKMIEYYNAMDLFVSSSIAENLPLVIQEAMSCGVPVVAFNVGGISDMVDFETGYLAKERDSNDLALGIIRLVEDREKLLSFGQRARAKIESEFSEEVLVPKFMEFYKSLL